MIEGHAQIGMTSASAGDAIFVEADRTGIEVGPDGMSGLIAYPGPNPVISLLQDSGERMTKSAGAAALHSPKSNAIVEAQT